MHLFLDTLAQTLRTLWSHRLRSFLTMFGIAWGVASLLLLVGMGEGFRSGNRREMEELGKDIILLFPGRAPAIQGNMSSARNYLLTYQDYLDVRSAANVRNAAPVLNRSDLQAVSEFASANGQIFGTEPNLADIQFLPIKQGRWLNPLDLAQKRNVIVLGDEMTRNLFPGRPALGSTILLNGVSFQVIGTLRRVGQGDNNGTNMRSYIPIPVMSMDFPLKGEEGRGAISIIDFQPSTRDESSLAIASVRKVIARNHGLDPADDDSFRIWDTIQQSRAIGSIFDAMNGFLGSVGLVTLVLGGIGVVNIMLVSVSERTNEIGLRKAVGATNQSILLQFFLEGALLTLISGAFGILGAGLLMWATSSIHGPRGFDPPRLIPETAILAITSLALAGVAAGLYPARRAANMTPVEALRKE